MPESAAAWLLWVPAAAYRKNRSSNAEERFRGLMAFTVRYLPCTVNLPVQGKSSTIR